MIHAGIIGATGYTGLELLRLGSAHPDLTINVVTSRSEQGRAVQEFFPALRGHTDLAFSAPDDKSLFECDVVFFATPNGSAMQKAPELLEAGVKVIDLSADFRLKDASEWKTWYGQDHACPGLLPGAVYGLPELNRGVIRNAELVANPGCYPTAVILGLLPLLRAQAVDAGSLIADAKSGASGAGRKLEMSNLFSEAAESFKAYGVAGHRHLPEIRQALEALAGQPVDLTFAPHLVPMIRGLHASIYAILSADTDVQSLFEQCYADEPFVDVLPPGSYPDTRGVRGTNLCRIAVHRPGGGRRVVVLSVIDNLVKGAAGQALQNMNLMFGLPETRGLTLTALSP